MISLSVPKKHHYVPCVYLQRWEDTEKLLWLYNICDATVSHRNKASVLYEDYLYSLTLREFDLMTTEQKIFFLEPLKEYSVFWRGKELAPTEIALNLDAYDQFRIVRKDGKPIKPRHKANLLDAIINGKHPLIENKFGTIEQLWSKTADFFDEYRNMVVKQNIMLPSADIITYHCKNLLEFTFATYTRNPYNIVQSIMRYEKEQDDIVPNNICRRIFEMLQLKYLNGEQKLFNVEEFDIRCIFTAPGYHFLTSDNPVCIRPIFIENVDFTGVFWFPISPHTLIALSKKPESDLEDHTLHIYHYLISGESVKTFNRYICENAVNFIISSEFIDDPRFRKRIN